MIMYLRRTWILLLSSLNILSCVIGSLINWILFNQPVFVVKVFSCIDEEEFGTAGLNPVLFAFIVLTSRLSGCTSSIEGMWKGFSFIVRWMDSSYYSGCQWSE